MQMKKEEEEERMKKKDERPLKNFVMIFLNKINYIQTSTFNKQSDNHFQTVKRACAAGIHLGRLQDPLNQKESSEGRRGPLKQGRKEGEKEYNKLKTKKKKK